MLIFSCYLFASCGGFFLEDYFILFCWVFLVEAILLLLFVMDLALMLPYNDAVETSGVLPLSTLSILDRLFELFQFASFGKTEHPDL